MKNDKKKAEKKFLEVITVRISRREINRIAYDEELMRKYLPYCK